MKTNKNTVQNQRGNEGVVTIDGLVIKWLTILVLMLAFQAGRYPIIAASVHLDGECSGGKGHDPASVTSSPPKANATKSLTKPAVVSRTGWGCPDGQNSPLWTPQYTSPTHLVVHHSAGANSSADWPAVVRGIWNYHTYDNAWGDIGYNFLIDPNGVIYEGRAGGDNVIGAHFSCANGNTVGVCILGTYTSVSPTTAALNSLKQLLAWKAEQRGIDPLGSTYHSGTRLTLANICGHRNSNGAYPTYACSTTTCPGDNFYGLLPGIRTDVYNLIHSDVTRPSVTINQAAGQPDPTSSSAINFTVVFSESVTGFRNGDVTLGGTAGATSKAVTGSGTTYNVAVSGMTQSGTVTATIPANAAQDAAGNNSFASTSTDNSVTYGASDANDQISEADYQGAPNPTTPLVMNYGNIDNGLDADMFGFDAIAGQRIALDVDQRNASSLDSYLRLFNASGTQLRYSDDDAAPGESATTESYLEYTFTSSGRYYVGVSGFNNSAYDPITGNGDTSGDTGEYSLTISDVTPRPANDNFANRSAISGLSFTSSGSNANATKESGEPNHAGNAGGKSVWWSWTAPSTGCATISTSGSSFDTTLGIYTGTFVSALTSIASDDDSGGNGTSRVTFNALAGTVYLIAIDGYSAASGTITLNVTLQTDATSPAVAISSPISGQSFSTTPILVTGTAGDSGICISGVAAVEVRVNGGSWQTASGTTSWNRSINLGPGSNIIEAQSRDNAGNFSSIASVSVTYCPADTTLPVVSITSPANGQVFNMPSVNLAGTAVDPGSPCASGVIAVQIRVNGGSWQTASGTTGWNGTAVLAQGNNTVDVRSRDGAGNYSGVVSVTVSYVQSNTPPSTPSNQAPTNSSVNQPLTMLLKASTFYDTDPGDTHSASRWLVRRASDNITVFDSGEDSVNKTICSLPSGSLAFAETYVWQVGYKDNRGAWSGNSLPTTFTTLPPCLTVRKQGTTLILSWPTNAIGFVLVEATNLAANVTWTPVSATPAITFGQYAVTIPIAGSAKFHRLKRP